MAKIQNLTASAYDGIAGPLIQVDADVNCGPLDVQPTLTERVPQGINPRILQLVAYPASDQDPESFRKVTFSKNLAKKSQYERVEVFDEVVGIISSCPVEQK